MSCWTRRQTSSTTCDPAPGPVPSRVPDLVTEVIGQLLSQRPLEDSLGHLPQQTTLAQQLHALLASLLDQRIGLHRVKELRPLRLPARSSHPHSVEYFLHDLTPLSNRQCGSGWRSRPYTEDLTRPEFKAYITDLTDPTPDFVIGAYHQLWRIEQSFRMSKHDLQARPIYSRKRESIEAHLAVVFAALAITRLIEDRTGWTIKKFVRTTRRYRSVQIRAGSQVLTAEDPLPPDLRDALALIN